VHICQVGYLRACGGSLETHQQANQPVVPGVCTVAVVAGQGVIESQLGVVQGSRDVHSEGAQARGTDRDQ
jgi:hypothetical protein